MKGANLSRQKVLLTGATGTLGYNILKRLAFDEHFEVIAPVREMNSPVVRNLSPWVRFVANDLSDHASTEHIMAQESPAVIVHCAARGLRPPKETWFDLMQFNVISTMRLFQMNCRLPHPSHFIYLSTGLVYREQNRPLSEYDPLETLHPYGASKGAADAMLQAAAAEFNRRLTILRPFAFTGAHDGGNRLFPLIVEAAAEGRHLGLSSGAQIRDFCAVDDIVDAVLSVIVRPAQQLIEKFNLGSGQRLSLRELILKICAELELKADLGFGESAMQRYEPHYSVANIDHARQVLGWEPRTNLAYAVHQLAQEIAPHLQLRMPCRKRAADGATLEKTVLAQQRC